MVAPFLGIAAGILQPLLGTVAGKAAQGVINAIDGDASINDDQKKLKAEMELARLTKEYDLDIAKLNSETQLTSQSMENAQEIAVINAKSKSKFRNLWRPFLGWVLSSGLGLWIYGMFFLLAFIVCTMLWGDPEKSAQGMQAMEVMKDSSALLLTVILPLLYALLGIHKNRTQEKIAGIADGGRATGMVPQGIAQQLISKVLK